MSEQITAAELNRLRAELDAVPASEGESDAYLAANAAYRQAYDNAPLAERTKHDLTGR